VLTGQQQQAENSWAANTVGARAGTGIYTEWTYFYMNGLNFGPPVTKEYQTVNFSSNRRILQWFAGGVHYEFDPASGTGNFYGIHSQVIPLVQPWFMYDIVVPFGDPNFDSALGGSHDLDIGAPANYPVTALLPGTIASITEPDWGKQVGVQLDSPYNGVPYFGFLHLSAVNPALAVGQHISPGDLIGWVGGANDASQYAGTSNPTGQNFLNTSFQSSRIQVGVALMRGSEYGGAGFEHFPPVDQALDPTQIILDARQGITARQRRTTWVSTGQQQQAENSWAANTVGARAGTGIYTEWTYFYMNGLNFGPPVTEEYQTVDFSSNRRILQWFAGGVHYEFDPASGTGNFYDIHSQMIPRP
jgi:hypothetical protein